MEYEIHDNGGRPFNVVIHDKDVFIFNNKTGKLLHEYKSVKQIFIGIAPLNEMTEFSGGHGPEFDGNSILLNILGNVYVHIGCQIIMFITNSPVVSFVSPVGNNDVPYPFAICENKETILLIEDVCLTKCTNFEDPYREYYDQSDMKMTIIIEGDEDREWFVRYHPIEEKSDINDQKYYLNDQPITLEDIHRQMKIHGEIHGFKKFNYTVLTKRAF
jgi:hypothetical protein